MLSISRGKLPFVYITFFSPWPIFSQLRQTITFSLCLPIARLLSVSLLLAIYFLSLLPASCIPPSIHLPITISNFLSDCRSAGAARKMEQRAEAGGTTADDRGGQAAPEVWRFRCRTACLQGVFSQQWTLRVHLHI